MPATKATPRTTAKVVARARTLRAQRLLRARLVKLLHQLDHVVGGARGAVLDELAVAEGDQAVGVGGGDRVVGDHDHRLAELVDRAAQQRRARRRSPSSRGCRSARRRRRRPVWRPARGRRRPAAAGRRRARRGGGCGGPRGRRCGSAARPTRWSGLRPAIESGSTRFSSAVRTGSRLKNWKTKPSLSRRSLVSSPSSSAVISTPSSSTLPPVGLSRPARMCIRVDLPEPEGPMIAVKRSRSKPVLTPASASTAASPSP